MTSRRIVAVALGIAFAASVAMPQGRNPGHARFMGNMQSDFDRYTYAPTLSQQRWFQSHFDAAVVYTPYFDTRTPWFPNGYFYQNLYGVQPGSAVESAHPEWILRDQFGRALYIPFNCRGGACPLYAGNIASADFRAFWIDQARAAFSRGNYPGIFIDDVNMEFRVSDGFGNQATPLDSNTGQFMTYDAWRNYVASFLEQIRQTFPNSRIIENVIWFAGPPGVADADPAIRRQIATATNLNLERGVASDSGLTGGTGVWSVFTFFNFVDRVHAAGRSVNFQQYALDAAGQQYGLASYFMISSGYDSLGDAVSTPDYWWSGYDVDLGRPLGPRSYSNGVFRRDFSGGLVLLGEPGLPARSLNLGATYTTLEGIPVNSVIVTGRQGIVLRGTSRRLRNRRP